MISREEIVSQLWEAVQNGGKIWENAQKLSKKTSVPSSTIVRWYYEAHPRTNTHSNSLLSEEQEQQLLYATLAMSHVNLDWTVPQIVDAADIMFGIKMSPSSGFRFLTRHRDEFSFQKPTSLGTKRTGSGLYDEAATFIDRYEQFLTKKKLPSRSIVNYDESRIIINDNSVLQVRRLISKKKVKPQHVTKVKGTHCGTYLPFVGANGEVLASYFILSVKFDENGDSETTLTLPSVFSRTRNGMASPVIFYNETGYLNGEIFSQIIDHFITIWTKRYPGLHCCLIGDNLAAHRDLKLIKKGLENGIYMTYLPAGTTHWSQPLDNLLFARLKQEVGTLARQISFCQYFTDEILFSLVDIVLLAAKKAFTSRTILRSFEECGLWPLDAIRFEMLASLNHDPSKAAIGHNGDQDEIVRKVVEGLQKCLSEVKKDVKAASERVRTIRVRVKKNMLYFADDILAESEQRKVEEELKRKEKELEKEKKEDDRKRKREENEKQKEENKKLREEKKAQKAIELEERQRKRSTNTCKAGCMRTCRIGGDWVGCEYCEDFWMCPTCYSASNNQQQLKKHERLCRRTSK